jgi:hypothetical protein
MTASLKLDLVTSVSGIFGAWPTSGQSQGQEEARILASELRQVNARIGRLFGGVRAVPSRSVNGLSRQRLGCGGLVAASCAWHRTFGSKSGVHVIRERLNQIKLEHPGEG